ncbi:radical SAM superfamily protein [Mycobacterium kansasii]|uniref:Radical SAM superfamily protein n=1 Tax=Mycobacterium kansasii TaxID=1768 RepID=A0A1V3XJ83_MYCKA|nr:radical SAM superfamily protein [Mycobacterium kansasii]
MSSVARLSGWLAVRDGLVWLERGCRSHGLVRTLYDEDPEILAYLEEWTAPTKAHIPDTPGNFDPIPSAYLRGLPQMQTQHTCILLEDIAETCNLRCPTCFADSSPDLRHVVAIGDVLANVDQRLERENGRLDVLMLSGGEPSLHPQLPELLAELSARPITRILLNTNGIRVAQDDGLLDVLTEHRERAEVYLQYDGLSQAAHRYHRGGDLRRIKQDALRRLSEREIFTTLVMTAALGVNDHEIGDVVRLALRTPYAGGSAFSPVRFGAFGIHRRRQSAHAHRCAQEAGATDRRSGHVAGSDRAAVLTPALLFGGVPAARRRRAVALTGGLDRSRQPQRQAGPGRKPYRRQGYSPRVAAGGT